MKAATYPFEATSDLPGVSYAAMRQVIMLQVKSGGLKVLQDEDRHLTVETAHGLIGLRPGSGVETAGYVGAVDEHWLFVMKNAVTSQMAHMMPAVAKEMRWSNDVAEGSLPPNFTFAQVNEVTEIGPNFFRVRLKGEDLSRHKDEAIHFRLVIPPKDTPPLWPTVAANGSVVWPEGDGAPHKPVYTARRVDHAANTMDVDVYIHEGGRVTDWARQHLDKPGAQRVVGLLGPSGGGLILEDRVLMATDETGFPAAARILENLPSGTTGEIFLEAENGATCDYPFEVPEGISVSWLSRSKGDILRDAALAALPDHQHSKVWFAGERSQAKDIREAAKAAGREASDLRISGFWAMP